MASPVDSARVNTDVSVAADPWTVNLGSPSGGVLLLMLGRANNVDFVLPAGWDSLVLNDASDASNDRTSIFYRLADGTEGATMSVDMSGSAKGATIVYQITGAENPATQAPQASTVAVGTGANPDPTTVTPTGGSKDYLFIAFAGMDGETQTYTAPTNYVNLVQADSGTGGAAATNVRLGAGSRQLTAASEDPGAFTAAAPEVGWTAYALAIHPTSGAVVAAPYPYVGDGYYPTQG